MSKWRRSWIFPDRFYKGDKAVCLFPLGGRAGVIVYSAEDAVCVADWEGTASGMLIWRNRIAQVLPEAGVPSELLAIRMINDIREAFLSASRQLIVN